MTTPEPNSERSREAGGSACIPAIESAFLNLGTAKSDCDWARHYWVLENWPDALMHIREAIAQLESARAKIEAHAKPNTHHPVLPGDVGEEP
jgi:hypothetical protein